MWNKDLKIFFSSKFKMKLTLNSSRVWIYHYNGKKLSVTNYNFQIMETILQSVLSIYTSRHGNFKGDMKKITSTNISEM